MAPRTDKVALVTGATGITGRHCIDALLRRNEEWKVISMARRDLDLGSKEANDRVQQVKADLLDCDAVKSALKDAGAGCVTHIFHCAYLMKAEPKEEIKINLPMLKNVVEGAEAAGAHLQHVFCMEGGKWYGQHLRTTLKVPHREDDPPIFCDMFYYDLQRYMEQRVKDGAPWSWSGLRPNPVCGYSTGSFMNLAVSLAVYASMCKELGLPLRFPGTDQAWESTIDVCDAGLLGEAMVHCATTPACANQAFNISNGDVFVWKNMWPRLAEYFGLETAPPIYTPLVQHMAGRGDLWSSIVKKHGLKDIPYEQLVTWQFADFVLTYPGSWYSTVNKLRRTGFQGMSLDSDEMFANIFNDLRKEKIIP